MDDRLDIRCSKKDKQAIKELSFKEDRRFSEMARLVIKDGIKERSKKK